MVDREESRTDLGLIKIHRDSVASIAAIAAREVEGVKAIGKGFASGIVELFRKSDTGGIKVEFDKNNEVSVDIPLVVAYGYNIPDVCARVQENVRAGIEKMTNLYLKDITINVRAIEKYSEGAAP